MLRARSSWPRSPDRKAHGGTPHRQATVRHECPTLCWNTHFPNPCGWATTTSAPGHLALGCEAVPDWRASRTLRNLGVSYDRIRDAVVELCTSTTQPT
jgi:hypothetical protein